MNFGDVSSIVTVETEEREPALEDDTLISDAGCLIDDVYDEESWCDDSDHECEEPDI